MSVSTKLDLIEYLVIRQFGDFKTAKMTATTRLVGAPEKGISELARIENTRLLNEFREELLALPDQELKARLASEQDKEKLERKLKSDARASREEQERFFNLSSADADLSHWSKAALWSLDEAIALSLGKAPELVKWGTVKLYVQLSPFALKYSRLSELASRAQHCQELSNPVRPKDFIAWARRNEIDFPEELIRLVESRCGAITDWKGKHDDLEVEFSKLNHEMGVIISERDALESRVAELEASTWKFFDRESPTYPPELDAAMQAWSALAVCGRDATMTVKEAVDDWVGPRFQNLSKAALKRVSIICNWEKHGGRPKTSI